MPGVRSAGRTVRVAWKNDRMRSGETPLVVDDLTLCTNLVCWMAIATRRESSARLAARGCMTMTDNMPTVRR